MSGAPIQCSICIFYRVLTTKSPISHIVDPLPISPSPTLCPSSAQHAPLLMLLPVARRERVLRGRPVGGSPGSRLGDGGKLCWPEAPLAFGGPEALGGGWGEGLRSLASPCSLGRHRCCSGRASLADLPQGAGGKSQMENPDLANE